MIHFQKYISVGKDKSEGVTQQERSEMEAVLAYMAEAPSATLYQVMLYVLGVDIDHWPLWAEDVLTDVLGGYSVGSINECFKIEVRERMQVEQKV